MRGDLLALVARDHDGAAPLLHDGVRQDLEEMLGDRASLGGEVDGIDDEDDRLGAVRVSVQLSAEPRVTREVHQPRPLRLSELLRSDLDPRLVDVHAGDRPVEEDLAGSEGLEHRRLAPTARARDQHAIPRRGSRVRRPAAAAAAEAEAPRQHPERKQGRDRQGEHDEVNGLAGRVADREQYARHVKLVAGLDEHLGRLADGVHGIGVHDPCYRGGRVPDQWELPDEVPPSRSWKFGSSIERPVSL